MLDDLIEISRIENQLNSLFNQLRELDRLRRVQSPGVWRPNVDIVETDRELTFIFELPGVTKEDVIAEIRERILIVRGTKRPPKVQPGGASFICIERRYGEFACEVAIDLEVEVESASARLSDGELQITFRKINREEDEVFRIAIDD